MEDNRTIYDIMENSPIIAAIKDMEGLEECCRTEEIKMVFVLFGDICSIEGLVKQLKEKDKCVMIHVDLIGGFSGKEVIVDFIREKTQADGIITTKPNLIRRGKELGLATILRYFLIDSMALENIKNQQNTVRPDYIEVLPGILPGIIKKISRTIRIPIIAGGLISDKDSVMAALSAGAIAVSTTTCTVWTM